MTIPNALNPFILPGFPVPNVTPFTYRDGYTFLERYEDLVKWINDVVIPWMNNNYEQLGETFIEQVNLLIQTIINNSAELQDDVFAALVANTDSESYKAINALLHDIIKPDPADPGTFIINETPVVNPDGLNPDPNDEGFFI